MRKNFKLLGAVAVAGVVATTGSAFTASNTLGGENIAGYGTDVVTGASTSAIEHTLSTDGTTITDTALTFTADLSTGSSVVAGFGGTLVSCTITEGADGADALPNTADDLPDTAACAYGTPFDTATATSFEVAVS
jgi:hypothetical protein